MAGEDTDSNRVKAIIKWLLENEEQINRPEKGELNFSFSGSVVRPQLTISGQSFKIHS